MQRIGLFGGSFDPVHLGHLLVAQAAREELDLARLFFIPAAQSPFKPDSQPTPAPERLRLLRLALAGKTWCEIDEQEIIAQRLGLDPQLVAAAKSEINPDDLRADKLLDDIRKERNRTSREREKLEKSRGKLEAQTHELEKRLEKIEDERREVLAKARAEGELEVAVLKQNIESLKGQLKKARQPLDAIKAMEQKLETFEEKIQAPVERKSKSLSTASNQSLKLGEKVLIASLKSEGIVTALSKSDAEVQIGSLRVRAKLNDLQRKGQEPQVENRESGIGNREIENRKPSTAKSPGMEISLRGKLVEDGLDVLDKYLEKAYSAGLPFVRIVHGKGTGRIREAVRIALKDSPYVQSFEEAHENESGAGVTIATMAK